jgi:hypothetical protein
MVDFMGHLREGFSVLRILLRIFGVPVFLMRFGISPLVPSVAVANRGRVLVTGDIINLSAAWLAREGSGSVARVSR